MIHAFGQTTSIGKATFVVFLPPKVNAVSIKIKKKKST